MSKELDKLIEQVLKEERLPVKWSDAEIAKNNLGKRKKGYPKPDKIKSRLGIDFDDDKKSSERNAIQNLINKDKKTQDLSKKDIENTYKGRIARAGTAASAAEKIRTTSTDSELRKDIEDLYKDSNLDKAQSASAQKAAQKAQAAKALIQKEIDSAVQAIKAKTSLTDKYEELGDQYDKLTSPKKNKNTEIFKQSFNKDEMLNLASLQQAGKLAIKGNPEITKLIKASAEVRRGQELSGGITEKGYTSFLTKDINGSNALTYYRSETGDKKNYNYTVIGNKANPIEPWYLDGSDSDNIQRIANLLNNIGNPKVRAYLDFFHNQSGGVKDNIFIHNLKVFQSAITSENISTKEGDLKDWWEGNMVARYKTITTSDPDPQPGLERTAIADQPFMSQAAGEGKMLDSQFSMFKTFFEGTPTGGSALQTLSARVKKLTDFTKELYYAPLNEVTNKSFWDLKDLDNDGLVDKDKSNNQYVEYLNKIMIFDYFNAMAKELDSGSGPYVFEAFCAYLAGGRVAGKEKGLKGGMGETDFLFDNGDRGSAKYLQTKTKFSQAADNFLQGVTVTYVFASKKGTKTIQNKDVEVGESDPDKIHYIDLYVVNVTRLDQTEGDTFAFNITAANAPKPRGTEPAAAASQNLNLKKSGDTKVEFDVSTFDRVGRVYLVEKNKKNIMSKLDVLSKKMDSDNNIALQQFAELTKYFKSTFDNLGKAKERVSEYSNTGKMEKGTEALTAMEMADTDFNQVITIVQKGAPPVNENKSIDSLIESIIKKNLFK